MTLLTDESKRYKTKANEITRGTENANRLLENRMSKIGRRQYLEMMGFLLTSPSLPAIKTGAQVKSPEGAARCSWNFPRLSRRACCTRRKAKFLARVIQSSMFIPISVSAQSWST